MRPWKSASYLYVNFAVMQKTQKTERMYQGGKTMKKILAVVLCLCMVIAILAGCSSSETPSSSTPSSSTPSSSQGSSTPASSDTPEPSGDEMTPAEKAIAERKASGN